MRVDNPPTASLRQLLGAGLACTFVSFPTSMTYGVIAFSPFGADMIPLGIIAGLFGAIIPALLLLPAGARTVLGVGPRAASVVIFAALCAHLLADETLIPAQDGRAVAVLAIGMLALLLAGLFQALAGLARVGVIVKYIPYPVVAGFINGTVLLILLSQIWPLLGMERLPDLSELFAHTDKILPLALLPGGGAMLAMAIQKRTQAAIPAPLLGLLAGSLLHHGLLFVWPTAAVGATLRTFDSWLPLMPLIPLLSPVDLYTLWDGIESGKVMLLVIPAALSIAVLSSFDTMFSITAMDDMTETHTDANRELRAHGIVNAIAALFGGLNGAGGLNRTKPALDVGVRDPRVHIVTGMMMLLGVVFLADGIHFIPLSVIAGVMIYASVGLFDRWVVTAMIDVIRGRTVSRIGTGLDVAIILFVMAIALYFNLIAAVFAGTLLSVILFAAKISRSPVKRIGRGPLVHSRKVWDAKRQAILDQQADRIALVKLQGAIFFGTYDSLERQLEALLDDGMTFIVLDFKSVTDIDISGARALTRFQRKVRRANGLLIFSYIKRERRTGKGIAPATERRHIDEVRLVWNTLVAMHVIARLGIDNVVYDSDSGLARCESALIEQVEQDSTLVPGRVHRQRDLLRSLTLADLRALRPCLQRREYCAGEVIFRQGEPGACAYYLASGAVDIRLEVEGDGETKLLQGLMPGAVFGEMVLFGNEVRSASAVSSEPVVCYRLPVQDFQRLRDAHPATAYRIISWICQMFSDRLRNANQMILELEE